jgi:hypothetical protein
MEHGFVTKATPRRLQALLWTAILTNVMLAAACQRVDQLTPNSLNLRGDYTNRGATNADGSTNIPLLISKLQEMGAKDFFHLILNDAQNWDDFQALAVALNGTGIRLWLYLPSVAETTPVPYGYDYRKWFIECAKLAKLNSSVEGIVLDDFVYDTVNAPSYYAEAMTNARSLAPRLKLLVVAYFNYPDGTYGGLERYLGAIDGVVAPYYFPQQNMEQTSTVASDIDAFRSWLNARTNGPVEIPLIVMIYAMAMSFHPEDIPSPGYVKSCLEIAMNSGKANGCVTYCLDKSDQSYVSSVASVYN